MTSLPLFSQTRPKISDSLVIRASPSHWKEGERPARARVTFTWISPHLPSLSRGWAPEEGADGTRRTPHPHLLPRFFVVSIFQSLTSTLFPFRNLSSTVSSRFASPILLGYTPVPPVPPTKKKERRAGGGIPEMWFVPEGSWWKNNNWEQGEKSQMSRFFWNVPYRVESTDTLPQAIICSTVGLTVN